MKRTLVAACVLAAACALGCKRTESKHETTTATTSYQRGAEQAQKGSEQALEQARKAQEEAAKKQASASKAQQEVEKKQNELSQAAQKASQERQQAEQAQREAQRQVQEASTRANSAQQQALAAQRQASAKAGEETRQGTEEAQTQPQARSAEQAQPSQNAFGRVAEARDDQVVLERQNAPQLIVKVDPSTQVTVGGETAAAQDLQAGSDVRVDYHMVANQPVAIRIQTTTPTRQGRRP